MGVRRYSLRILKDELGFYYRIHPSVVFLVGQVNKIQAHLLGFNSILTISNVNTHSRLLR